MTYRKFKADYLFLGDRMAASNSVLITTAEGRVQGVVSEGEAGEGVEEFGGLLSPGFVNCHCHLELSHLRGVIPEGTGLVDFLSMVIGRRGAGRGDAPGDARGVGRGDERGYARGEGRRDERGEGRRDERGDTRRGTPGDTRELVQEAIAAGEQEMLKNGIVAVGDICNTTDTLGSKMAGRMRYRNFIETMGFIDKSAAERFGASWRIWEAFEEELSGSNSIVPHAPYSVSPALMRMVADFPGNRLLSIHNQESAAENEFLETGRGDLLRLYAKLGLDVSFFRGTGQRSLAGILPYFHPDQSLILVHNVATAAVDLGAGAAGVGAAGARAGGPAGGAAAGAAGVAAKGGVGATGAAVRQGAVELIFCLCPLANLYIGGRLPDVRLLVDRGCRIVVGTDSLASNHQLSILEELKALQRGFPWLRTSTLLQWATFNGAAALQMEGVVGSFGPGMMPGVLLLEGLDAGGPGLGRPEGPEGLGEATTVRRLV